MDIKKLLPKFVSTLIGFLFGPSCLKLPTTVTIYPVKQSLPKMADDLALAVTVSVGVAVVAIVLLVLSGVKRK